MSFDAPSTKVCMKTSQGQRRTRRSAGPHRCNGRKERALVGNDRGLITGIVALIGFGCMPNPSGEAEPFARSRAADSVGTELTVGPEVSPVTPAGSSIPQTGQAAAANSQGTSLVVWSVNSDISADIYGARVDTTGAVLSPGVFAITSAAFGQRRLAVASDGTGWLVAWEDQHAGGTIDVYGARVAADGTVL